MVWMFTSRYEAVFESGIKMKIRLDQKKMKVVLETYFFPLMQSRYEFPLSLDIQGQLVGRNEVNPAKAVFKKH